MAGDTPLDSPEGTWWDRQVNRRETLWLGLTGAWALTLFGWMLGWSELGNQNPVGPSRKVSPEEYQRRVQEYKAAATDTERGLEPAGEDVYIGALQWAWDGLPVVLEAGREYDIHMGSYDVQHGLSIRHEENLSKQMSLQVLPDYEWVMDMTFDEPGTYHVICNEFCGTGHRSMHGRIEVV